MNKVECLRERLYRIPDPEDGRRSTYRRYKDDPLWVDAKYTGPRMREVNRRTVSAMLAHFLSRERRVTLHYRYFVRVLLAGYDAMKGLANVVRISVPPGGRITVVGDLHGQFYDLAAILARRGRPSPGNYFLFNGDFVDRGPCSTEVLLTVYALKALYPEYVFLNRGNHETPTQNRIYGFTRELRTRNKYPPEAAGFAADAYHCLPLAHIINDRIFVAHAGLSLDAAGAPMHVQSLAEMDRFRDIPEGADAMCGLLWSDVQEEPGTSPSHRGVQADSFGPDVTERFLRENGLSLLVRSHESQRDGISVQQGGLAITVFSAPNYAKSENKGGIVAFESPDFAPIFHRFMSHKIMGTSEVIEAARATVKGIENDDNARGCATKDEEADYVISFSDDNDDVYFNANVDSVLEENDDVVFNTQLQPPELKMMKIYD